MAKLSRNRKTKASKSTIIIITFAIINIALSLSNLYLLYLSK